MAAERPTRFLAFDLALAVKNINESYDEIRFGIQTQREADFAQRVIDEDLSYDQQLAVRKEMVKLENTRVFPDNGYINTLKEDMRSVRKLSKAQKVRTDYTQSWSDYQEGILNVNKYIAQLEQQLSSTNDAVLRGELEKELAEAQKDKRQGESDLLTNRTTFAKEDGSVEILNEVISELQTARAVEAAVGNEDRVALIDARIASLNKQLNEAEVEQTLLNIEFDAVKSGARSLDKLKTLNNQIASSDSNIPITINGTRFESASQYWEFRRNAYVSGDGSGIFSDFFNELNMEIEARVDAASNVNQFGMIPAGVLQSILDEYSTLEADPNFAPFGEQIRNARNSALANAVNQSADAILNSAKASLDWTNVDTALNTLESRYGIDLTTYRAQAAIDRTTGEGTRLAGIRNQAQEQLIAEGANPSDPGFAAQVTERINQISLEAGFTAPEVTPTERAAEEPTGPPVPEPPVAVEDQPPSEPPVEEVVVEPGEPVETPEAPIQPRTEAQILAGFTPTEEQAARDVRGVVRVNNRLFTLGTGGREIGEEEVESEGFAQEQILDISEEEGKGVAVFL